ncbi:MAG TPA: beta-ketoacyl-ACP synthase III [bacterium]
MRPYLASIGAYVPEKILTNADFEKIIDTTDEWIRTRSGIVERHVTDEKTTTSDLAVIAVKRALEGAKITAVDVGAIVVGTATPDMPFPSTACLIQSRIGARKIMSFDVTAGCSGFLYALGVGESLVKSGIDNVLVVGAETLTKITDYTDRTSCFLFGDGAGAVVLKKGNEENRGILASYFAADGADWRLLYQPAGGSRMPASHKTVDEKLHVIKMAGNEVFKFATRALIDASLQTLKLANIPPEKIDLLIPHQANIRIIEATAKRLQLGMDKVFINIDKYGNTSSASIPLALDEAVKSGRVKSGSLVLMVAFGAGFTWAGVLVRW